MKFIKLKNISLVVVGILAQFIFSHFNISTNILIWEISLDLILIIMGFVLLKYIYNNFNLLKIQFSFYEYKSFIYIFIVSNVLMSFVLIVGLISNNIFIQEVKNLETILIGVIFDIPAFIFFSIFTILVEELFFRILLFNELNIDSIFRILISSLLFSFYKLSSEYLLLDDEIAIPKIIIYNLNIILYYFAIGFTSFALFYKTKNILNSFVFRISFLIFIPLIINLFSEDKPTIFQTDSLIFSGNGILISIIILFFGIFTIVNQKRQKNEI